MTAVRHALTPVLVLVLTFTGSAAGASGTPTLSTGRDGEPTTDFQAGETVQLSGTGWVAQVEKPVGPPATDPPATAEPPAEPEPEPPADPDPRAVAGPLAAAEPPADDFPCEVLWAGTTPEQWACRNNAQGTVNGSVQVPPDAKVGDYRITVCAPQCDGAFFEVTTPIRVVVLDVQVPTVLDQTYGEVMLTLETARLRLAPSVERPADPESVAVAQSPAPGEWVRPGTDVSVTFESSPPPDDEPEPVAVPDLSGLQLDEATTAAGARDLALAVASTSDAVGLVVDQEPTAGELVEPGTTIVVSLLAPAGPATVPDVVGLPLADAERVTELAGFILRADSQADGLVVSQNPPAGSRAPVGSLVGVQLAVPTPDESSRWPVITAAAVLVAAVAVLLIRAVGESVSGRSPRWARRHVHVKVVDGNPSYFLDAPFYGPTVRLVPRPATPLSALQEASDDARTRN